MKFFMVVLLFILVGFIFTGVVSAGPEIVDIVKCDGSTPNEFCDDVGKIMFGFTGGNIVNLSVGIARTPTSRTSIRILDGNDTDPVTFFDTDDRLSMETTERFRFPGLDDDIFDIDMGSFGAFFDWIFDRDTTNTSSSGECSDSDGGREYSIYGIASNNQASTNDQCSGNTLFEAYCNDGGAVVSEEIVCLNGCSGGMCSSPPNCVETDDSGQDYFTQGTVTYYGTPYTDYCSGGTSVVEYWCTGLNSMATLDSYYCTYNCTDGACNSPP